jgi:hypothetical protein
MTATGTFAPIAPHGYPGAMMQVIGPDGIPMATHEPVPTPSQMPGIYSVYPHPALDAAPINMEAHLAARVAAGYIHPDDRAAMAAHEREEYERAMAEQEEMEQLGDETIKEEEAAVEAAAAVANLDSTAEEAQEAAEIAAAMAQDAFPKEEPQESEAPSEEVQV